VQQINRDDLRVLLDDGTVTPVEALPAPHYDAEHLPGAANMPGDLTQELAAELAPDPATTVVNYCSGPSCGRSKAAAAAFVRLRHTDVRVYTTDVRVYTGGKTDWAAAGLPFYGARVVSKAA
jgi:rhodanese-related sulfurtransferase